MLENEGNKGSIDGVVDGLSCELENEGNDSSKDELDDGLSWELENEGNVGSNDDDELVGVGVRAFM